jgi:hypothetical protein
MSNKGDSMRAMRLTITAIALVLMTAAAVQAQIAHGFSNIFVLDTVTTVNDGENPPPLTTLLSIYPNPSNPRTTIEFALAEEGVVEIAIFDPQGRLVRMLDHETRSPGRYRVTWSGQDGEGRSVSAGTYFCRLIAGGKSQTVKVTLLK